MALTFEQQKAINTVGSNILISAGAGSGKTTVLSERVIRILKSGVDVDRLIILTFTNAAAAEMKSRIKAKISEIEDLKPQLAKLENAQISTFDSFCLSIVKQYHYLLNLPQDVEIADNILLFSIKEKFLDETMNDFYQEKPTWFIQAIDLYFDKGDQAFKEILTTLDKGLEMIPDADSYLANLSQMMYSNDQIQDSIHQFESLILNQLDDFKSKYFDLIQALSASSNDKLIDFKSKTITAFKGLSQATSLDQVIELIDVIGTPSVPRASKAIDDETINWLKSKYNPLKEAFVLLKKEFETLFISSKSDIETHLLETKSTVEAIVKVLTVYRQKVKKYQFEHHFFDFIDIMHLAIELLSEHPEVRESIKNHTYEIMVDEYQDTNDLQEHLVHMIGNDNVFMVGDAKQSIYGFRNANPQNFIEKYHQYSQNKGGFAIDLTYNFRSRKEVIEGINSLFNPLMDEQIGGVDYQNNQALQYGNQIYELKSESEIDYSPEIMTYAFNKEETMSQAEIEARIIAYKIRSMIDSGTPVMNLKVEGGIYEPARYEHFCILVDRKSDFDIFEKVLNDAGMPVDSIADELVVASTEVLFFNQVLKLMKCYIDPEYFKVHFKHAFYGVARSFVYGCDDDTIISLFINHSLNSLKDTHVLNNHPITKQIHDDMTDLSSLINQLTISELVKAIVDKTQIYQHIATLNNPDSVERKLDFLFAKVRSFRRLQFDDLIQYFDDVYSSKNLDIEYSRPIDFTTNAIRLMTMHKAKGLEFPFCFYPGLDKSYNLKDIHQGTLFDKSFGLVLKADLNGFIDTIWHKLIRFKLKNATISEKIRLFYVALTRTKEKMFIVLNKASCKEFEITYENNYITPSIRRGFRKYHDFFDAIPQTKTWEVPNIYEYDLPITPPVMIPQQIVEPIRFETLEIIPKKMIQTHFSKSMKKWMDDETKQSIQQGLSLHKVFETFDFSHPNQALKILTPENAFYIKRFLSHPLLHTIEHAIVYQEYPFTLTSQTSAKMGVIDLLIVYPDHVDIIDYKLKHIDDEAYTIQLKGYLDYIHELTQKPVNIYLYSIINDVLKPLGGKK